MLYISICRKTEAINSASIGGRGASEKKNHLSLALKNEDTHHSAALVGKWKQFLQRGKKNLVLFYFVGKAPNSLLFAVLNNANVERWANIRDQKQKAKASREQGNLDKCWSGSNKMRNCFEKCKIFLKKEELRAAFTGRKQLSKQSD